MTNDEWAADRERVAAKWFRGDAASAEAVLDALPYSSIPTWEDLDTVMETVAGVYVAVRECRGV